MKNGRTTNTDVLNAIHGLTKVISEKETQIDKSIHDELTGIRDLVVRSDEKIIAIQKSLGEGSDKFNELDKRVSKNENFRSQIIGIVSAIVAIATIVNVIIKFVNV